LGQSEAGTGPGYLAALLDHMKRLATRQPILMFFEDLHWIERTSLELLSLRIEQSKD
jgi:predicted ATPase